MNPSYDPAMNPDSPAPLRDNLSTFSSTIHDCAPILSFHPQQLPMEFLDGSSEYQEMAQDSLADAGYVAGSDLPRYLTMPIDLNYQQIISPTEDHNNAIQTPQPERDSEEKDNEKYNGGDIFKKDNKKPVMTNSRRSSGSSNKFTSDESGIDKRERNRMAASKCRKKQKLANSELQEKARIMSERHNYLIAHKASLESETISLKNELLMHGSCGCEPISDYLMQAARKFVKGQEEVLQGMQKTTGEELCERTPSSTSREPCIL
ncbi:uncharacterized protein F4812DRAFT_445203 [Daldinia caldariorum]|uniref:uncharacterized protein n=1 Tax=Daldinia caldariorum TaxID=326644 RepID=UPI002008484F|nr:uncharacterized protein F4812DRAFT_445203 [Daldinia caldariorum]KAI1463971.1 hypothetical protein F4812DRAFT_445203 [Daldinia caldariorum]